jgi:molybdate transport system substrate-binding protein
VKLNLNWMSLALACGLALSACATVLSTGVLAPSSPAARSPVADDAPRTLTVFAAASLTEAFSDLGRRFESSAPGVKVRFSFAGSQQLRAQLEQGAQADVFAPANTAEMNKAIAASLVAPGATKTFARNRLIVVFPMDNPGEIRALADLARPGTKVDIADKAVPVGQYTLDMFDKMGRAAAFGIDFRERVLANVVSRENNVKAIVSKVRLSEVDAGVVYATDAAGDAAQYIGALQVPDGFNQVAIYPIAVLSGAPQPDLARQFVEMLLSRAGQQVLVSYGFIPAEGGEEAP